MGLLGEVMIPFRGLGGSCRGLAKKVAGRDVPAGFGVLVKAAARLVRNGVRVAWGVTAPKPQPAAKPVEKAPEKAADPSKINKEKAVGEKTTPKGPTAVDQLERAAIGALCALVALTALGGTVAAFGARMAPYLPAAAAAGMPALLIAAWAVAPEKSKKKTPQSSRQDAAVPPPVDAATVAALVRQIAAAGGWQGVHLDDLLAHLPGRSKTELLDALAGAGIPVAEQLKLTLPGGRQRNRQGVRVSALPQGLGEDPPAVAQTPAQRPAQLVPQHLPDPAKVTVHGGG